jgi:G6PDH family F420-dependent oxidoreductase
MLPGRFFLGLGTGENLNEHVLGDKWPSGDERLEMLEEAIEIIRLLWEGGEKSFSGNSYTVEDAQLFTLPEEAPPIYVAATGPEALELAGNVSDGLITTDPQEEIVRAFREAGGDEKPKFVKLNVCWAESEAEARQTYQRWWPSTLGFHPRFHGSAHTLTSRMRWELMKARSVLLKSIGTRCQASGDVRESLSRL